MGEKEFSEQTFFEFVDAMQLHRQKGKMKVLLMAWIIAQTYGHTKVPTVEVLHGELDAAYYTVLDMLERYEKFVRGNGNGSV